MTIENAKHELEERYSLTLIEENEREEGAYLEIAKCDNQRFMTCVGDSDFANTSAFRAWRSAHRAMLKAVEVEDYNCAIQDIKEARDFADGQLEAFYAHYKDKILAGLKAKSA